MQNQSKREITFDTQLKTALSQLFYKKEIHPGCWRLLLSVGLQALFSLDPNNLQLHCFFVSGPIVSLFILLFSWPIMRDVANGVGRRFLVSRAAVD